MRYTYVLTYSKPTRLYYYCSNDISDWSKKLDWKCFEHGWNVSPGIFTSEPRVPKGPRGMARPIRTLVSIHKDGGSRREESWLHLEAVEAVQQRGTETPCIFCTESERDGARRSDRCPVDQNVMYANEVWQAYRIPGPRASSSRFILLPIPLTLPPGRPLDRASPRPGRSIRFRKNVLYKQKQIKTLILLYVNRWVGGDGGERQRERERGEGRRITRGGAACLLSLQARTRAFFLASPPPFLLSSFHRRLAASRQPIHLVVDTYTTVLLIRHLYVIEKTAIFAVGGTVQWWKAVADTTVDNARVYHALSVCERTLDRTRNRSRDTTLALSLSRNTVPYRVLPRSNSFVALLSFFLSFFFFSYIHIFLYFSSIDSWKPTKDCARKY